MKLLLALIILLKIASCGGNQSPPPYNPPPPVDTGTGKPPPVDTPVVISPDYYAMSYQSANPLVIVPEADLNQINDINTQVFEDSVSTKVEIGFKGMIYRIIASDTANVLYIYGISGDVILSCDSIRIAITTKGDTLNFP